MAQDSWPNSGHNSRNVTDAEYEKLAARFSDDGIWGDPNDTAVVVAGTGLQVLVKAGKRGSLRGHHWYAGSVDDALTIAANSSGSTRIDRVVLRLDRSNWTVRAVVKQGTPGAGAPALTQDVGDSGTYEVQLAQVTVVNNAASVTVQREELYIGSRIRPVLSTNLPLNPKLGEIEYHKDLSRWVGWDGTARRTIWEDTGLLTISPGFDTWEQVFANVGRRVGAMVWLRVWVERQDSTFAADDPDGSKIGVIPAALRSTYHNHFSGKFSGSGGRARIEVRPDGEIWVTHNDSNVTVGRQLVLTMTYLQV